VQPAALGRVFLGYLPRSDVKERAHGYRGCGFGWPARQDGSVPSAFGFPSGLEPTDGADHSVISRI